MSLQKLLASLHYEYNTILTTHVQQNILKMKQVQRMATQLIKACLIEEDLNQQVVQPSKTKTARCPNYCKFSRCKRRHTIREEI